MSLPMKSTPNTSDSRFQLSAGSTRLDPFTLWIRKRWERGPSNAARGETRGNTRTGGDRFVVVCSAVRGTGCAGGPYSLACAAGLDRERAWMNPLP